MIAACFLVAITFGLILRSDSFSMMLERQITELNNNKKIKIYVEQLPGLKPNHCLKNVMMLSSMLTPKNAVKEDAQQTIEALKPAEDWLQAGRLEQAYAILQSSTLDINQHDKNAFLIKLARAHLNLGQREQCLRMIQKLNQPSYEPGESLDNLTKRVNNNKDKDALLEALAESYLQINEKEKALETIKLADTTNRDPFLERLTETFLENNDKENTLKAIHCISSYEIKNQFYIRLAESYLQENDLFKAHEMIGKVLTSENNEIANKFLIKLAIKNYHEQSTPNTFYIKRYIRNLIWNEMEHKITDTYLRNDRCKDTIEAFVSLSNEIYTKIEEDLRNSNVDAALAKVKDTFDNPSVKVDFKKELGIWCKARGQKVRAKGRPALRAQHKN